MTGLRSQFRSLLGGFVEPPADLAPLVTEEDLAPAPPAVAQYIRLSGAVGRPRVWNFRAVFEGSFRNGTGSRWMSFRSEQYNRLDRPSRAFFMRCRMFGLPVDGLHVFLDGAATMRVRLAGLVPVAEAQGSELAQSETVTLFNDLCLLAPGALLDSSLVEWEDAGPLHADGVFHHAGRRVRARLTFSESGDLTCFRSEDRLYTTGGQRFERHPWFTPVHEYAEFHGRRVARAADAVWEMPSGPFCYGRFRLQQLDCNYTVEV